MLGEVRGPSHVAAVCGRSRRLMRLGGSAPAPELAPLVFQFRFPATPLVLFLQAPFYGLDLALRNTVIVVDLHVDELVERSA